MLGTHNSYHQAPPAELLAALGGLTAGPLLAWQYSHPLIGEQLDAGVRAFELDAFWDPSGGLFGQVSCLALQQYGGGRARHALLPMLALHAIPARRMPATSPSFCVPHPRSPPLVCVQAAGLRIAGQNGWLSDPAFKEPGFKVRWACHAVLCSARVSSKSQCGA